MIPGWYTGATGQGSHVDLKQLVKEKGQGHCRWATIPLGLYFLGGCFFQAMFSNITESVSRKTWSSQLNLHLKAAFIYCYMWYLINYSTAVGLADVIKTLNFCSQIIHRCSHVENYSDRVSHWYFENISTRTPLLKKNAFELEKNHHNGNKNQKKVIIRWPYCAALHTY